MVIISSDLIYYSLLTNIFGTDHVTSTHISRLTTTFKQIAHRVYFLRSSPPPPDSLQQWKIFSQVLYLLHWGSETQVFVDCVPVLTYPSVRKVNLIINSFYSTAQWPDVEDFRKDPHQVGTAATGKTMLRELIDFLVLETRNGAVYRPPKEISRTGCNGVLGAGYPVLEQTATQL
jgi:hypothetical protein